MKNKKHRIKKMVIFTTTYKTEMGGIKDLLVILGKKKEVIEIDKEYQKRKLLGPWGLSELAKLYQEITADKLKNLSFDYCQKNLLTGMKELTVELKNRGFLIGVLNANPQFMMDSLKEFFSLDFAEGTQLEFQEGVTTGRIQKEVNRYIEAEILKQKIREYGIDRKNVITMGRSSITHLPIAKESGLYIGFDPAKETIKDVIKMIRANENLDKIIF